MTPSQPEECGLAPHPQTVLDQDRSAGDAGTPLGGQTFAGWWAVIPALVFLGLALVHGPQAGSLDDAFVVLSDARQWLHDGPLGSAVGRVEGSTSLLDCSLKALWLRLLPGLDPLMGAGLLGLLWLIAIALVTVRTVGRWSGSSGVAALAGCLMVLSPGLTESAGYLLEGPLFALLWILALVAAVDARPRRALGWALLLAAARPEGLALAPVILFWAGRQTDRSTTSGGLRWTLGWGIAGLGVSALVTAIRFAIYGDWVPNTFHAKSSDSRFLEVVDGWQYLMDVAFTGGRPSVTALALFVGAMGAWLLARGSAERRNTQVLLGFAALYTLGLVFSGGDSYTGARLFMPVALPIWLALGRAAPRNDPSRGLTRPRPRLQAWLLAPLMLLAFSTLGPALKREAKQPWRLLSQAMDGLAAGPVGLEAFHGDGVVFDATARALGPDEVFAHLHTQRFRWFEPGARVLDLTGLTNRRVARLPAPGPVRFGRASVGLALEESVGAIHLDPLRGRVVSLVDAPDLMRALSDPAVAGRYFGEPFLDPELATRLAEHYVAASRRLPGGGGYFNLLVRADLGSRFQAQGFRVTER